MKSESFLDVCRQAGLPIPVPEYRFTLERMWRFDWVFPYMIAVECQGGVFIKGKHGRGSGIIKDYEKLNAAQILGWIVLQFTPRQLQKCEFVQPVKQALAFRKENLVVTMDDRIILAQPEGDELPYGTSHGAGA